MKSWKIIIIVVGSILILQATDLRATLLPNEIKIEANSVKHGPEFGKGWTDKQRVVWNKTQEWWQLRMASDWDKLLALYHKDAIMYSYFKKVPYSYTEYVELVKFKAIDFLYCTVHEIRIIDNVAIVMLYYERVEPSKPKRVIFVWMKQDGDWKVIASMSKEE